MTKKIAVWSLPPLILAASLWFYVDWASGVEKLPKPPEEKAGAEGGAKDLSWLFSESRDQNDWPCWRGPERNGIACDDKWDPSSLKSNRKIWEVNVGDGYSSVSIRKDRLYTVGNEKKKDGTYEDTVYCLRLQTGEKMWGRSYPCGPGSYPGPRATPALDGDFVYSFSREGHLFCLKADDGEIVWIRHVGQEFQAPEPEWGFASSPCVAGSLVLVNAGESGMAFDKRTGATVWSGNPKGTASYATPVLFEQDSEERAAIFSAKGLYAVAAKTGKVLWFHPWTTSYDVNAPDPVYHDGRIFLCSGYNKGCALLDVRGAKPSVVWEHDELRSHFGSVVLIDGCVYGIDGQSLYTLGKCRIKCMDWDTGKVLWQQEGMGFGAFVASGDTLLFLGASGRLSTARISSESYQAIASAEILSARRGSKCWTMPVLCRGLVLCRSSDGNLACVDLGKRDL